MYIFLINREDSEDGWDIRFEDLEFDELVSSGSAGDIFLGYYFGTPVAIKSITIVLLTQELFIDPSQKDKVKGEYNMLK